MATIYHITTEQQWHHAQCQNQYEVESLRSEGFIHCSDANQVVRVANHLFKNTRGLILLYVETEMLNSRLVYENTEGGEERFPHVYGAINLDAIVRVSPFEPAPDGTFDHHAGTIEST
jgi:uncharacterized protein (DUF952 family)